MFFENEIASVRKFNALTDFEKTIQTIQLKQIEERKELNVKRENINEEIRAEKDKVKQIIDAEKEGSKAIINISNETTNTIVENDKKMAKSAEESALRRKNAFASSFGGGQSFSLFGKTLSLPPTAEGGIVNSPQARLVGEAGPEAIIPLKKAGGILGGVTVNINNPSVRDDRDIDDLAEKVGQVLLQQVNQTQQANF